MNKRVLLYGDSNTWGYISGSVNERYSDDERWSAHLSRLLGRDYTLIEEGYVGRTTVWTDPIEGRMSGYDYLAPCLDSHAPLDLVLLMLGTNDLKTYFSNTPFDVATGAERLIKLINGSDAGRDGKTPKTLLVSPIHIKAHPNEPMFGPTAEKKSLALADEYRRVAERTGAGFVDASLYARSGPGDGLHIDPLFFPPLAEAFAEMIGKMLSGSANNKGSFD